MKKLIMLFASLLLVGCTSNNKQPSSNDEQGDPEPVIPGLKDKNADYGVFLGRSNNNVKGFQDYNYVAIDFEEYSKETIQSIKEMSCGDVFGYLNVGSIENYRDYYDQFEGITIADYENWPDERWIDVSDASWQNYVVNTLAKNIKNKGGTGVYMDNVDIYSVCIELKMSTTGIISGLKNIIKGVADLGLKVMVNGGAEFFDDMNDKKDSIFDSVWGYNQEEVFSLIKDYEKDIFGKQDIEDQKYYQEIAEIMKAKNKEVFLLEYTVDSALKTSIKNYCINNNFHYYISSTVDLK